MAEEFAQDIVLEDDFDYVVEESPKIERVRDFITSDNLESIILTKNINLLIIKFMSYTIFYLAIIGIILLQIITYKGFEKLILIPIIPLFVHQCYMIIKTIQKNSIDRMEITNNGFTLTDNQNTFFIDYANVAKVEINTHRYTHFGMFKLIAIITINHKEYNIIFKVDYDEDDIIDRIKLRLKNHEIRVE